MKKAGIIGGSGYTGGELIRIILNHPKIKLEFVYSSTRAGSLFVLPTKARAVMLPVSP